jgi:hypothetical protein
MEVADPKYLLAAGAVAAGLVSALPRCREIVALSAAAGLAAYLVSRAGVGRPAPSMDTKTTPSRTSDPQLVPADALDAATDMTTQFYADYYGLLAERAADHVRQGYDSLVAARRGILDALMSRASMAASDVRRARERQAMRAFAADSSSCLRIALRAHQGVLRGVDHGARPMDALPTGLYEVF